MIESFKDFVRKNPRMVTHVNKGDMTWQKFYELYDLYGEDSEVWDKYLKEEKSIKTKVGISDFVDFIKGADLASLEEGINSVQRVIGVLQDLSKPKEETSFKPRPLYKHFED